MLSVFFVAKQVGCAHLACVASEGHTLIGRCFGLAYVYAISVAVLRSRGVGWVWSIFSHYCIENLIAAARSDIIS